MPKKSKKEKILADLRRTQIPTLVKKEVITPVHTLGPQQASELTAIKRDLYKTFILASLAIAAEVIIYWFSRR